MNPAPSVGPALVAAQPATAAAPSKFRRCFRIALRSVWLAGEFLISAGCFVIQVIGSARESRNSARARWLQQTCRRMFRVFGGQVRVQGAAPTRGLLVSNHVSYVDILVLGSLAPTCFVAKLDVKGWPLFGWFAQMAGTIFVDRERRGDVVSANARIQDALNAGRLLVLFPEGTSSDGASVLPFRSSLLQPAVGLREPLHAACVQYALRDGDVGEELAYWGDMTLLPHLLNLFGKREIAAVVAVAPLANAAADRKELALRLHAAVARLHQQLQPPPRS